MPLTYSGFTTRQQLQKGEGHIHTDKWHRCIEHVKANSPGVEPHAVCTHSIGYAGSINPEHRTGGPHASANPKRFRTKEGQRSARAREKASKYADVLKFDPKEPRDAKGQWTSSGAGGLSTEIEHGKEGEATVSRTRLTPAQQEMQNKLAEQAKKPVRQCKTPEEAVELILQGENVELTDTKHIHTVLSKLADLAKQAAEAKKDFAFDPCNITVKGTSIFCNEKIKTEKFPNGIPRIEMPQFKSKNPVKGSEADKLPRDENGEVDATDKFKEHLLATRGVKSEDTTVPAAKLKASQAEMEGAKVAGMMANTKRNPKTARILVSSDNYVIDGHHTWAAAVGRDAADGNLDNDAPMEVVKVNLTMSEVYHAAIAWTNKMGLPAVGVKKWDDILRFRLTAA